MILMFLNCTMDVKSKSLWSTPAVLPVVDLQDLSCPAQVHGIWEWRDIRSVYWTTVKN